MGTSIVQPMPAGMEAGTTALKRCCALPPAVLYTQGHSSTMDIIQPHCGPARELHPLPGPDVLPCPSVCHAPPAQTCRLLPADLYLQCDNFTGVGCRATAKRTGRQSPEGAQKRNAAGRKAERSEVFGLLRFWRRRRPTPAPEMRRLRSTLPATNGSPETLHLWGFGGSVFVILLEVHF